MGGNTFLPHARVTVASHAAVSCSVVVLCALLPWKTKKQPSLQNLLTLGLAHLSDDNSALAREALCLLTEASFYLHFFVMCFFIQWFLLAGTYAFTNYVDLGAGVLVLWYGGSLVMEKEGFLCLACGNGSSDRYSFVHPPLSNDHPSQSEDFSFWRCGCLWTCFDPKKPYLTTVPAVGGHPFGLAPQII